MAGFKEPDFEPFDTVTESTLSGRELAEFLAGMTAMDGTNYLDIYREAQSYEGNDL